MKKFRIGPLSFQIIKSRRNNTQELGGAAPRALLETGLCSRASVNYFLIGKKNLPVPKAKGGKMYRHWKALNFSHYEEVYMKLVGINC